MGEDEGARGPRGLGDRLGGIARRVGAFVAEVSETVTIPEALRLALDEAAAARREGELDRARAIALEGIEAHPSHAAPVVDLAVTSAYEQLVLDRDPKGAEALSAAARTLDKSHEAVGVAHAISSLRDGEAQDALDQLRRAGSGASAPTQRLGGETAFLAHVAAARAHDRLGERARAMRELRKARARAPDDLWSTARAQVVRALVDGALASGGDEEVERIVSAERIRLHDAEASDPLRAAVEAAAARLHAVRGSTSAALAALEPLADDDAARVQVAVLVDEPERAASLSADYLRRHAGADPRTDARHQRWWGLASLRVPDPEGSPEARRTALEALAAPMNLAAGPSKVEYAQELAYACLVSDCFVEELSAACLKAGADAKHLPELVLLRVRTGAIEADDFDEEGRLRLPPPSSRAPGPDELSLLRDRSRRARMLAAHAHLAEGDRALERGNRHAARTRWRDALLEAPELPGARRRLASLVRPPADASLEDLLREATAVLAEVPDEIDGIELSAVGEAMRGVVSARERLARPLTIAVMGEFSSGKSTFVNALLGESVAPTGALPTTNTINVFRSGPAGGARVHHRDGSISTVSAAELESYLGSIDDTSAEAIRHLEIDRAAGRMGDTAVVDTPGLNALDEYHERVAREFIEQADAVVWVFSATRGSTASEAALLDELHQGGRRVLGILNKVDTLSEDETKELVAYLDDKLGNVLVDLLPLSATRALEARVEGGEDSFEVVDDALERHFLNQARELKDELTRRRLREALASAAEGVRDAAAQLEARAGTARDDEARLRIAYRDLCDALETGLVELDDLLTRELLALRIAKVSSGIVRVPDPSDAEYLDELFAERANDACEVALGSMVRTEPELAEAASAMLGPWLRGYLWACRQRKEVSEACTRAADAAKDGEKALQAALRERLDPLARACGRAARGQANVVIARARGSLRRQRAAPLAEAATLRATALANVEALLKSLDGADAAQSS